MTAVLSRSRENALVGGVCSGIAEFLNVNPSIVRLFFILLAFGHGIGAILYLMLWIMLPINGQVQRIKPVKVERGNRIDLIKPLRSKNEKIDQVFLEPQSQLKIFIGCGLMILGVLFLLPIFHVGLPNWLEFDLIWPLFLLFGGLALLFRRSKGVDFDD